MKKKLFGFFRDKKKKAEKDAIDLNLKIYVNKPSRKDGKFNSPMLILTRKKAERLRADIAKAMGGKSEYVRINITGELNPEENRGKDYSFIAMEEMKAGE